MVLVAACFASAASAKAQTYAIREIGLTDAAHTQTGGAQFNFVEGLNATGQVAGTAYRYSGSTQEGQDTWFYSLTTNTTQLIGLTDAMHTGAGGTSYNSLYSLPDPLTAAGQVVGFAWRYSGSTFLGEDTWVYTPTANTTHVIGPSDSAHIQTNGYSSIQPIAMNAGGQVAGTAERFNAGFDVGQDAWLYSPTTNATQIVGLTDSAHTETGGTSLNTPTAVNGAGQVVGYANRYSGSTNVGQDAWFYSPAANTTQVIGLTDPAHTQTGGVSDNNPIALNDVGQVAGTATRYSGSTNEGQDAWLYSSVTNTTQVVGVTDSAHTQTGGVSNNSPIALNGAGQVAGTAARYSGSTNEGQDSWLYSPTTNTAHVIGLNDSAHTQTGGYSYSNPITLNNSGQVAGYTYRYSGNTQEGQDAWSYSPTTNTTQLIGLTDAVHTKSGGYSYNYPTLTNAAGDVVGYAERYSGATGEGNDFWFYDPATQTTFDLVSSPSASGFAISQVEYLGDDGTVLGYYDLNGNTSTQDAFLWTETGGFDDLGTLVQGGLTSAGWARLTAAVERNDTFDIAGTGMALGASGQQAFLLTPVPEPTSMALMALATACTFGHRRQRA
jgi:hypothetical protein